MKVSRLPAVLAAGALAASVAAAPVPTATSLVQKMQKAQTALNRVSVSSSIRMTNKGRTVLSIQSTTRQNDPSHVAIRAVTPTGPVEVYRNGDEAVIYQISRKEFLRVNGAAADNVVQSLNPSFAARLLGEPDALKSLKRAKVQETVFDKVPSWRIAMTDTTNKQQPTDISIIIGKQDSLPRKFAIASKNGQAMVALMSYQIPAEPYAAQSFVFTPPAGVTEAKAPAEQENPGKAYIGKPAADFTLTPMGGGEPVTLSSLKGKTVLIDFWATWCGPCRASLPLTNKAAKSLKDKGLVVLTVNDEQDESKVSQFMKTNGYSFTVLRDLKGDVAKLYNVQAIPTTILVGPDGNVAAYNVGFEGEEGFWKMLSDNGIAKP